MLKIALFVDNTGISEVDVSNIEKGNPGIGGTEYMFFLLAQLLSARVNNIIVKIYTTCECKSSNIVSSKVVRDVTEAYVDAQNDLYDFFVIRNKISLLNMIRRVEDASLDIIVWCHNFSWYEDLDVYSREKLVKRLICVGKEQMDLYLDHRAYNKSEYIYNCIDIEGLSEYRLTHSASCSERGHIVTYMGSIVPWKGFHILAEAWPRITEAVPDAHLYVIGSGNLYSRNKSLGKYGIASEEYENQFMPYLLKDGRIMENVHFMGVMGSDKYDLLAKTKVGVVNPSGISETFGISAVEMQAMGVRVVAKKCVGFIDTVRNGQLFEKDEELSKCVIEELLSKRSKCNLPIDILLSDFSYSRFVEDWEKLLNEVIFTKKHLRKFSLTNPDYNGKRHKYRFYRFANSCPFVYNVSDFFRGLKISFQPKATDSSKS